jgi:hypothetical protein
MHTYLAILGIQSDKEIRFILNENPRKLVSCW